MHCGVKGNERCKIHGVRGAGDRASDAGDEVYMGDKKVGVVTRGMYSSLTGRSTAIARLDHSAATHGTKLQIRGKNVGTVA